MQKLIKKVHCRPLCSLQAILLQFVVHISPCCKSMVHAGEIDVLIRNAQSRNNLITILLQLWSIRVIILWGQNLNRHLQIVNLLILKQGWMSSGHGVDERRVGRELEDSPATVAEPYGANFGVPRFKSLGGAFDFRPTHGFTVSTDEIGDTKGGTFSWVVEDFGRDDFAIEARQKLVIPLGR